MLGIDIPVHSASELERINKKALDVGLNKDVYHGSPALFDTIKPGLDQLIHVAPTLEVPVERLRYLMGSNPDIEGAFMYPLKTRIENPLRVTDSGDFSYDALMKDEAIKKILSKKEMSPLEKLRDIQRETIPNIGLGMSTDEVQKIMKGRDKELSSIKSEGMDRIQEALKKRGYDSLHYKNQAEVDPSKQILLGDAFEKQEQIRFIEKQLKNAPPELRDALQEELKVHKDTLSRLEKHIPDSYALFKDTPLRSLDAAFDPKKIKTHPNKLLYGGVGVVGASGLLGDSAEAATEALSPVLREDDGSPVNLMEKSPGEAIMRGLTAWDNVTGKPVRKGVYDALLASPLAPKDNPSGYDIVNAAKRQSEGTLEGNELTKELAGLGLEGLLDVTPVIGAVKTTPKFKRLLNTIK